jgi:hypothetical protein
MTASRHHPDETILVRCGQCGAEVQRRSLPRHRRAACGHIRARGGNPYRQRPTPDLDQRIAVLVATIGRTQDAALKHAYRRGLATLVHWRHDARREAA